MLWKLFYGKSKEEYFQEVMDRLTGMDSHYSDLSSGMEDVRGLLEDSRMNGGLQEEKIDRLLTIMEDWMNTYEEKVNQLGVADEQELKRELERERERSAQAEQKEKEYEKRITSLQVQAEKKEKEHGQRIASLQDQAEEYKRKQEESEQSVWAMQKEVQSLKNS
ncbi:hypothetical protein [Bacillus sp. P14.5]|uniref:hypothetical protein n=1 Tax=Bacillus sp. P14.5 TaxID=1983400 RepID=UPI000DE99C82|nr:hypothetical protein [Bacillus sp. P14.5]